MSDIRIGDAILNISPEFKAGDMPPSGYLDWHEWAETQIKAGLKQVACSSCGKWKYPQELSSKKVRYTAKDRGGKDHQCLEAICLLCAAAKPQPDQPAQEDKS